MIKVVTGFAYIPGQPRTPQEYDDLGKKLYECDIPLQFVMGDPRMTWMYMFLKWSGINPTHSVSDNPKKNSLAYHCVQHEKIEWMCEVAMRDKESDVFMWIDYGIFSVPGITATVIEQTVRRAENEKAITIPGCWDTPPSQINDQHPCWRFCGGVFVIPRKYLFAMKVALQSNAMHHIYETNNASWEVNTFARMEQTTNLPIWWYQADHNASMFTNYPEITHES
jgi:hypothetical protein